MWLYQNYTPPTVHQAGHHRYNLTHLIPACSAPLLGTTLLTTTPLSPPNSCREWESCMQSTPRPGRTTRPYLPAGVGIAGGRAWARGTRGKATRGVRGKERARRQAAPHYTLGRASHGQPMLLGQGALEEKTDGSGKRQMHLALRPACQGNGSAMDTRVKSLRKQNGGRRMARQSGHEGWHANTCSSATQAKNIAK